MQVKHFVHGLRFPSAAPHETQKPANHAHMVGTMTLVYPDLLRQASDLHFFPQYIGVFAPAMNLLGTNASEQ